MCGLAGIIGPQASRERVLAMRDSQVHRGPDARGIWEGEGVVLGHTRLRVIDLTEAADQPLWTPDGRWGLVYNGEIYNYRKLRDQLEDLGHRFRSQADSEVVLHAWSEWGSDALNDLDGMYAFGIWDRLENRLSLARDRLGIKPLYWHRTPEGTFSFASEVRALLASELPDRRLDRGGLSEFLSQQTAPTPRTLIEGVRMLEPGCWLSVELDEGRALKPDVRRYWHPLEAANRRREARRAEPETYEMVQGIRERLGSAVDDRLVSDAPLGAFLSGGVDSTAVVALMAEAQDEPVRTFTVAFEEDTYRDDAFARTAAEDLGTEHEEVRLSGTDLLDRVPSAVADQDHPSGDGINTWIVSQAAREAGLTVALSGLGGDELFGGYPSFRRWRTIERFGPLFDLPGPVGRGASNVAHRLGPGVAGEKASGLLRTDGSAAEVYPVLRQVFGGERRDELLNDEAHAEAEGSAWSHRLREEFGAHPSTPPLARISHAEATCYMRDVLLRDTDQMSMAHSLEVRVPLLDHELVEYVLSLPDEVREPTSPPKKFLVAAVGDRLPDAVAQREKAGFAMPFDRWMRGPLESFCEEGIESVAAHGAFDSDAVRDVWTGFQEGKPGLTWSRPWLLVALGRWLDREAVG